MKSSILFAIAAAAIVSTSAPAMFSAPRVPAVCADCVAANMRRLAGEDFHGRGCGTGDENAAARYIAETLRRSRVAGGLGDNVYLQPVQLLTPTAAAPPTLTITSGVTSLSFVQGRDIVALQAPPALGGPLLRLSAATGPLDAAKGRVVIYDSTTFDPTVVRALGKAGALAIITPATSEIDQHWSELADRGPGRTQIVGVEVAAAPAGPVIIFAKPGVMVALRLVAEGEAQLSAPRGEPRARTTYNVVGVLRGKASDADRQAVLLTAHYDHLGVRKGVTFHGANDDASGTAAVLEFARILGGEAKPRRTVYFGLFGCEEEGALGAQYFLAHAPMAVTDLVANLEFEMIGMDDPKRPGALMLTGWDKSDLGPTLAAHGARIGADLYPEQNFFQRSDNYQLALKGVVAHTISAWPVPPTYHQPTDDLDHVDLTFMTSVIGSLVEPITWLANSAFQPTWNAGQKP